MKQRTVVVAPRLMDPVLLQMAREACALAGADCHDWAAPTRLDALTGSAVLALGVLPAGARRIPSDLAAVVTEQLPGLPLLLVAEEPLVRPVVCLQDGLVTLLEAPSSAARLASCLRLLLAEATPSSAEQSGWWRAIGAGAGTAVPATTATLGRREYRTGRCWIGVLEGRGAGPRPPVADAAAEPGLAAWLRTSGVVSAIITPSRDAPPSEGDDLGAAVAMIRLEVSADRSDWVLRSPVGAALVLFSAQRFPAFSDLFTNLGRPGANHDVAVRRLAAASGDIMVALWPAAVAPDLAGILAALDTEAGTSGAALLDVLEARLRGAPEASCCVAIEVQ